MRMLLTALAVLVLAGTAIPAGMPGLNALATLHLCGMPGGIDMVMTDGGVIANHIRPEHYGIWWWSGTEIEGILDLPSENDVFVRFEWDTENGGYNIYRTDTGAQVGWIR